MGRHLAHDTMLVVRGVAVVRGSSRNGTSVVGGQPTGGNDASNQLGSVMD